MKTVNSILCTLVLLAANPITTIAAPENSTASAQQGTALKYKMIAGYKQQFNDDLQLHLSQGWTPVGGVAVTTWNNDLYFAQLISRPASQ